jgi:hypothetical protein
MYYSIEHSTNTKIVGKFFQAVNAVHNCHVWDEPKFIEHINFEKVDFEPITSNAILEKKAKLTDLISCPSIGFSLKLLISGKFKDILEKNRKNGMHFFKAPIIQNNIVVEDYWILNFYEFNHEYVDFLNSKISYTRKADDYKITYNTIKEFINIENLKEFEAKRSEAFIKEESLSIEKLSLFSEKINEDFFVIKYVFGGLFYVSEKLKKEIEDAGCTGIEFQPAELSYNEWTMPGGEREKIYGKV